MAVEARTKPLVKGNRLVKVTRCVDAETALAQYKYDAWNRLVKMTRCVDAETTVAQYEYDGRNRRTQKVVSKCGTEHLAGDGGDTTVHFYYGGVAAGPRTGRNVAAGLRTGRNVAAGAPAGRWNVFETRNGSNQTTFQYLCASCGTGILPVGYVDELMMIDKNGDPTESNDCDPDDQTGESTADARYFVHQDRNWNVAALTEYDPNATNNGRVVERYSYTPYGQFIVLNGDTGSAELGNVLPTSTVGNVFAHQSLPFDHDKGSYQNRHREYVGALQRFGHADPVAAGSLQPKQDAPGLVASATCDSNGLCWYRLHRANRVGVIRAGRGCDEGVNLFQYARSCPALHSDPLGLSTKCGKRYCLCSEHGSTPITVHGNSKRAKCILELWFGKGTQGCVTLLIPQGIFCTCDCQGIKDVKTDSDPPIPILDHECCHACDYLDDGLWKYLGGWFSDDCDDRPVGGFETW